MSSEVYCRVLVKSDNQLRVCVLQDFDECDYDSSLWITGHKFDNEAQAEDFTDKVDYLAHQELGNKNDIGFRVYRHTVKRIASELLNGE